jgi:hypothetical protein
LSIAIAAGVGVLVVGAIVFELTGEENDKPWPEPTVVFPTPPPLPSEVFGAPQAIASALAITSSLPPMPWHPPPTTSALHKSIK